MLFCVPLKLHWCWNEIVWCNTQSCRLISTYKVFRMNRLIDMELIVKDNGFVYKLDDLFHFLKFCILSSSYSLSISVNLIFLNESEPESSTLDRQNRRYVFRNFVFNWSYRFPTCSVNKLLTCALTTVNAKSKTSKDFSGWMFYHPFHNRKQILNFLQPFRTVNEFLFPNILKFPVPTEFLF